MAVKARVREILTLKGREIRRPLTFPCENPPYNTLPVGVRALEEDDEAH